ncbi:MAG: ATP-binding protein [Azospirillaceae bacterium]
MKNWRNFTHVAIDLRDRAFFVGPNASGKSNLLDALRFLREITSVGGGLEEAVQARGGMRALRCLAARRDSAIRIAVVLSGPGEGASWHYELEFGSRGTGANADLPRVVRERVVRGGEPLLERPLDEDRQDEERLRQTHLQQISANTEFRAIADFFETIAYMNVIPQVIRDPERAGSQSADPFGGDLIRRIADTRANTRKANLKRIEKGLQIVVPQLQELDLERDQSGFWHLRGRYKHWRPKGAWQNEHQFSDGTLRLLGILWALLERGGPLLLEEPEQHLHSEVTRHLPALFQRIARQNGRQVLVSTHSEVLLSEQGLDVDEVFMLVPSDEGTKVVPVADRADIGALLAGGQTMGEAVLPYTSPKGVEKLPLFDRVGL